jgi:hypothetical protein
MAGLAGTVSYVMLPPGQYSVEFSLIGVSGDSRSSFTYTIQGAALTDPIGPIVHDPTYTPIYLGPPGPITTYRYPNGTISTIPYLWVSL